MNYGYNKKMFECIRNTIGSIEISFFSFSYNIPFKNVKLLEVKKIYITKTILYWRVFSVQHSI